MQASSIPSPTARFVTGRAVALTWPDATSPLIADASFDIDLTGPRRIGIAGPNGHGKTTLVRMICGALAPTAGTLRLPWDGHCGVGVLPQAWSERARERPLGDFLRAPLRALEQARAAMSSLEREMATATEADPLAEIYARYAAATDAFDAAGGWDAETRLAAARTRMGLDEIADDRLVGSLSSGERTRAGLARLMATPAALYVFDEPTNHLDTEATEVLEDWLETSSLPCLLVSHDRALLDAATSETWWVERGELTCFPGAWSAFEAWRDADRATRTHAHATQQREIGRLESALRERMGWAHRKERQKWGPGVMDRGFIGARAARHAKRAKAVRERIEHELETRRAEAVWLEPEVTLELPPPGRAPAVPLAASNLRAAPGAQILFERLSLDLRRGERVVLTGPNGSGKSTLVRILAGADAPLEGQIARSSKVSVAWHRQELELRPDWSTDRTPLELLDVGPRDARARTMLGVLGLADEAVHRRVGALSPGQQARLALAEVLLSGADVLLLDEPTNHLDVIARVALEDALCAWSGTALIVSHDRRFAERVATRTVALSALCRPR